MLRLTRSFRSAAHEFIKNAGTRERLRSGVHMAGGVFLLAFAGSWIVVPLYQLICGAQGGVAKKEGIGAHKAYAPPPNATKDRLIKVEFASSVQGRLKWSFEPEQKYIYVTPGETALAFFKAKNRSLFPVIGTSVYHMIPPEAGIYLNKIQCFCFDEQLLAPGEEIEMPVFFFIDPEIVKDRRFDDINTMTLTYIFMEAPGAEIPEEYKELEQRLSEKVTGIPPVMSPLPTQTVSV
jgi:cytochrome c oxidase assembly protein subunit 11